MKSGLGDRFLHSDSVLWTVARIILVVGPVIVMLGIALILFLGAWTQ